MVAVHKPPKQDITCTSSQRLQPQDVPKCLSLHHTSVFKKLLALLFLLNYSSPSGSYVHVASLQMEKRPYKAEKKLLQSCKPILISLPMIFMRSFDIQDPSHGAFDSLRMLSYSTETVMWWETSRLNQSGSSPLSERFFCQLQMAAICSINLLFLAAMVKKDSRPWTEVLNPTVRNRRRRRRNVEA